MLVAALILFVTSLILGWAALYVLTRNIDTLNEIVPVSAHAEYSVTEAFFSRLENHALDVHSKALKAFYHGAYKLLTSFLPWFRKWTRSTERRLQEVVSAVKGKKDLPLPDKEKISPYLRDIRSHAESAGDGTIHDKQL